MKLHFFISIFCAALAFYGCSDDNENTHNHGHTAGHTDGHHGDAHSTGGSTGHAHDHPPTDDSEMCAEKADEFSVKLAKDTKDKTYTVQFIAADPAPPDVGKNTWTVEVTDSKGEAVEGLSVVAEPVMPHHGHGTFPETWESVDGDEAGQYIIQGMDLSMSGYWETTLYLIDKDGNQDSVMFIFCLEG